MRDPTVFILGGYGMAGLCLARLLLQETGARLVLAGRSLERARQAAAALNAEYPGGRVAAARADAADAAGLREALADADLVLVASGTSRYIREVAAAALAVDADYLDIMYGQRNLPALETLAPDIAAAGRCFITEAGFHPGLPAAAVRYAAARFDRLDRAVASSAINHEGGLPLTTGLYELVEELRDYRALVFRDGRWQAAPLWGMRDYRRLDFGPLGARWCTPMTLPEMLPLTETYPELRETGFYIAGFNWFVDGVVFPLAWLALTLWPRAAVRPAARLLHWGTRRFARPPYGTVLQVQATGVRAGREESFTVAFAHRDSYMFTAIPVVACLLQYLDGTARRPGLWLMGHLADPDRLVRDMERMGVQVTRTIP